MTGWIYLNNLSSIEELIKLKKDLGANIITINESTALNPIIEAAKGQKSKSDMISKTYPCPVCQKIHTIKVTRSLIERADHYPLSYLTLIPKNPETQFAAHLILLYLDANGSVRGVEQIKYFDIPLCYEETQ